MSRVKGLFLCCLLVYLFVYFETRVRVAEAGLEHALTELAEDALPASAS